MSLGDITYDTDPVGRSGNVNVLHGQIECDTAKRPFAILSTNSRILRCTLQDIDDDPAYASCIINENASAVAVNGTIAVDSSGTHTYAFRAEFV
jgi:hypothetical protein